MITTKFTSTALNFTALHCTALYSTALHCTILHCTPLRCSVIPGEIQTSVEASLSLTLQGEPMEGQQRK